MARLNVPIMLLSIALSTSAWFILYGQNLTRTLSVPVSLNSNNVTNLPRRFHIDSINDDRPVVLRLTGPSGEVNIAGNDPDLSKQIGLDLTNAVPGDEMYPLVYGGSVRKLVQSPTRVAVKVEEIVTKSVPVKVELRGKLQDPNSSLTSTPTSETSVNITAPKSVADMITEAKAVLQVSQINPNNPPETVSAPLLPVDATGRVYPQVEVQPDTVKISPIVGAAQVDKTVIVSADIVGNPALGYVGRSYKVTPSVLHLSGVSNILVNTSSVRTEKIDITGLNATKLFKVHIITPEGTTAQTNVAYVRVVIERDSSFKPGSTAKPPNPSTTAKAPPDSTDGTTP